MKTCKNTCVLGIVTIGLIGVSCVPLPAVKSRGVSECGPVHALIYPWPFHNHGDAARVKVDHEAQLIDTGVIRTSNILFDFGKADIKPESHGVMDAIGAVLVKHPELKIEIGGHTDNVGGTEVNRKLSRDRALAVLTYMLDRFRQLDKDRFSVRGYGESSPIASNDTDAGRAKNRRVEFKVLNEAELKRFRR